MRITGITVFQVDLPLHEGAYRWSEGKFVEVFDSTIVRLETDEGIAGHGEVCPLGPFYLPAYAGGARAAIAELAPHLLGVDPTQVSGRPVAELLGGRYGEDFHLYRAISQDDPEAMADNVAGYREEGYRRFQLKVGGDPETDIERIRAVAQRMQRGDILIADANTGWLPHEAMRVVRGVSDVDVYIEQPCLGYDECLSIRRHTNHPFVLDESIDGPDVLMRAISDRAMDVVNIKISKFGGLTRARLARDLCVSAGIGVTIEDSWGGDVTTAAIAHLAHSTPPRYLFTATDFNSYVTRSVAPDAPRRSHGRMAAPDRPGLGITPDPRVLGSPVFRAG